MLADLETGLVAAIKASALGKKLRQTDALPDLDADSLVKKFATDAPAVYVALGSFPVKAGLARVKYGVACVARNSRSANAARHGDGLQIGLHEMLDAALGLLDGLSVTYGDDGQGGPTDAVTFEVTSCDLITSEALYAKGIYAGVVQLQSSAEVDIGGFLDPEALADFETFHADYDVDPHVAATEHDRWLAEPPDHSTSAPDLSETVVLQE